MGEKSGTSDLPCDVSPACLMMASMIRMGGCAFRVPEPCSSSPTVGLAVQKSGCLTLLSPFFECGAGTTIHGFVGDLMFPPPVAPVANFGRDGKFSNVNLPSSEELPGQPNVRKIGFQNSGRNSRKIKQRPIFRSYKRYSPRLERPPKEG